MSNEDKPVYNLAVGEVTMALGCPSAEFAEGMAGWFDRPSSTQTPHLHLDLEVLDEPYSHPLPNSLLKDKTIGPDGAFDIASGLITGRFDRQTRRGVLRIREILLRGRLVRVLEQIFYQAFHSARALAGSQAFLIHSSAVIRDGQGFLFVGPSEAGKSTVAQLSSAFHVLGDEMSLVQQKNGQALLVGTPFNGLFRNKQPGQAPLRAVFLLNQASAHAISKLGSAEAATALAAEIVPDVGLDQTTGPETIPQLIDQAADLLGRVPVHRLEFRPDSGFWATIAKKFNLNLEPEDTDSPDEP